MAIREFDPAAGTFHEVYVDVTGAPDGSVIMKLPGDYWHYGTPAGSGTPGPQGPEGPAGPAGATGATGDTGPAGPAGPQGEPGTDGLDGSNGVAGPQGNVGPAGPKGDIGATGAAGAIGPKGDTGATGLTGSAGPAGPKGDMGAAGAAGATGSRGAKIGQAVLATAGTVPDQGGAIVGDMLLDGGTGDVFQCTAVGTPQTWAKQFNLGGFGIRSFGTGAIPALALGATANVVVALTPPQPDTNYFGVPVVNGGSSLLGGIAIQGIAAKATNSITYTVKNSGLVALGGGVLEVTAMR